MADITPHPPLKSPPVPKLEDVNPRETDNGSKPKAGGFNADPNPRETGYGTAKK